MYLYLYEGTAIKGEAGESLVKRALTMYLAEQEPEACAGACSSKMFDMPEIMRSENGKPYFSGKGMPEFSVSHSGQLWVCLMADFPVGIDIQEERAIDAMKTAQRFFTDAEQVYVDIYGTQGFFRLWTYKEAYTKLRGERMLTDMANISVICDDAPAESIHDERFGKVFFKEIEIGEGISCAACSAKDEEIWVRLIE